MRAVKLEQPAREIMGNLVGRSRAHFRIVAKLGEGGMGIVYKATDARLRAGGTNPPWGEEVLAFLSETMNGPASTR